MPGLCSRCSRVLGRRIDSIVCSTGEAFPFPELIGGLAAYGLKPLIAKHVVADEAAVGVVVFRMQLLEFCVYVIDGHCLTRAL